jgi:hypothetical protein
VSNNEDPSVRSIENRRKRRRKKEAERGSRPEEAEHEPVKSVNRTRKKQHINPPAPTMMSKLGKKHRKEEATRRMPPSSSDIELERLEPTADSCAARTRPTCSLFCHQNLNTGMTDATDTFRAGERVFEQRNILARGTVDLRIL